MPARWTKSLFKHTENRERRKNSDKSSPPQPSLFHLCLPNPPPHHTPELTAAEFAGAVRENELKKPIFHLCLPKPPPHHTQKLTATEVVGAVRGAWKHTGAAMSHDPKVFFLHDFPFSPIWIRTIDGFFCFLIAFWLLYVEGTAKTSVEGLFAAGDVQVILSRVSFFISSVFNWSDSDTLPKTLVQMLQQFN